MNPAPVPRPDLARLVVDLCRLRRGPQDFPYSPGLLLGLFAAGTALDTLGGSINVDAAAALASSLLSSGVVLALCWLALKIRGHGNRYVQTASALLACSLAFTLLQLPLMWLSGPPPATAAELGGLQILLGWAMVAVFLWQVAVSAHIMRHAMDAPYGLAFALVATWVIAYWALDGALFGVPA